MRDLGILRGRWDVQRILRGWLGAGNYLLVLKGECKNTGTIIGIRIGII